jgi:hypothetical protein
MNLMEIKTLENVARINHYLSKNYTKIDVHSHAITDAQLQRQFRAWPYQQPSSNSSDTRRREI